MDAELRDLIANANGLDISDEIALLYPKSIYMKWGDEAYEFILDIISDINDIKILSNSSIILESMPYYSDGPPLEFVVKVSELMKEGNRSPEVMSSCLTACISEIPIWRESKTHLAIKSLLENTLKIISPKKTRLLERNIQRWLRLNALREEAIRASKLGSIKIPENVVERFLKEDQNYDHILALNRVSCESIAKMLIASRIMPPVQPDKDSSLETYSFELISSPEPVFPLEVPPRRQLIDITWVKETTTITCKSCHFGYLNYT